MSLSITLSTHPPHSSPDTFHIPSLCLPQHLFQYSTNNNFIQDLLNMTRIPPTFTHQHPVPTLQGLPISMSFGPKSFIRQEPNLRVQPALITSAIPNRVIQPNVINVNRGNIPLIATNPGKVGPPIGRIPPAAIGTIGSLGSINEFDPFTPGVQAPPAVVKTFDPTEMQFGGNELPPQVRLSMIMVNDPPVTDDQIGNVLASGLLGGALNGSSRRTADNNSLGSAAQNSSIINKKMSGSLRRGVDVDPISPGVQLQPGVLTVTGPTIVLPSILAPSPTNPMLDSVIGVPAPIKMTDSKVYVARDDGFGHFNTIQSYVASNPYNQGYPGGNNPARERLGELENWWDCCPKWFWILLGVILSLALVAALFTAYSSKESAQFDQDDEGPNYFEQKRRIIRHPRQRVPSRNVRRQTLVSASKPSPILQTPKPVQIPEPVVDPSIPIPQLKKKVINRVEYQQVRVQGNTNDKGQIVSCPLGSHWNGEACVFIKPVQVEVTKTAVKSLDGEDPEGASIPEEVKSTPQQSSSATLQGKKVPIFSSIKNDQAIGSSLKGPELPGVAPTTIKSKPTPSVPASAIDAKVSASSSSSDFKSSNVVTVPAIVTKRSVAPTMTYSGSKFALGCEGDRSYVSGRKVFITRLGAVKNSPAHQHLRQY